MKRIISRLRLTMAKTLRMIRFLVHAYKFGGYARLTTSNLNRGEFLQGKRILITGGGSGIGLSIARKCLAEGAEVLITGRNETKLNRALEVENNASLKSIVWDVSIISDTDMKLNEAAQLLNGEIDILVNNAGIVNAISFPQVTEQTWDSVYATNSKGLFFLTQSLCKHWIQQAKSSPKKVINISSQGGFVGATYPYRMSKWDIAGLTQGLGLKLAPHGIIVNGIAPGITATSAVPFTMKQEENVYCPQVPLQRYALPEDIAELAIFLMSDAANFIIGQTIVCDGGYSIK